MPTEVYLTRQQRIISFKLSQIMGLLRCTIDRVKPKSFEHNRLSTLENQVGKCFDEFRIVMFNHEDRDKARYLADFIEEETNRVWSDPEQHTPRINWYLKWCQKNREQLALLIENERLKYEIARLQSENESLTYKLHVRLRLPKLRAKLAREFMRLP